MREPVSNEIKVWDPAVRIFHWTLAISFAVAFLTEDDLELLHVYAGYLVGALLVFRVIWGFVGSRHARFRNFVRGPAAVTAYLKEAFRFSAPRHVGHNPAGGAMVVALLISLAITVLSGLALYGTTDFAGPLAGVLRGESAADMLEEVHEFGANFTLFLVVLHLGGVLLSSLEHRENLVRAMINGRKKENPA
jgi:cytochrome b